MEKIEGKFWRRILILFVLVIFILLTRSTSTTEGKGINSAAHPESIPCNGIVDEQSCRLGDETDYVCSGRGECVCGVCECYKREIPEEVITGTYCECDNFSCERENRKLCSGADHGICQCGICMCLPGWAGPACACSTDIDSCANPLTGEICNGKGRCVCGKCVCDNTYSGRYCQQCQTCPNRCEELMPCIQCKVHMTGKWDGIEECQRNCPKYPDIQKVDVAESEVDETFCASTDPTDECRFYYIYGYKKDHNHELYIKAQEVKDCPPEPPIRVWMYAFGLCAGFIVFALISKMIWRLTI